MQRRPPALDLRRLLRQRSTDAERALWWALRDRRLGPKFRRQHAVGPYVLDFYCVSARVAVELDGGHHYDGAQHERDLARDAWLHREGIRVLRFSDREALLETEAVCEAIWRTVNAR
jgi:ATP-dependent helicase HrpA/adenine-specific DNA-methyltransferase